MIFSYIDAICEGYPGLEVYTMGNPFVYEDIVTDGQTPIPAKATLDAIILTKTHDYMWRKIQAERDKRKAGGVLAGGYWFHTDDASRIQHIGLVMLGVNMPNNTMWKTLSGAFVLMTPLLASQIFSAVATADQTNFAIAEQHKAAMIISENPETYNFSQGWVQIYGE